MYLCETEMNCTIRYFDCDYSLCSTLLCTLHCPLPHLESDWVTSTNSYHVVHFQNGLLEFGPGEAIVPIHLSWDKREGSTCVGALIYYSIAFIFIPFKRCDEFYKLCHRIYVPSESQSYLLSLWSVHSPFCPSYIKIQNFFELILLPTSSGFLCGVQSFRFSFLLEDYYRH